MPRQDKPPIQVDPKKNLGKWFIFDKFGGFKNRDDASQLQNFFVVGQNVSFSGNSLPAIRDGYEVIGTEASDTTPVKRAWIFRRRDDVQIEIKAYNTGLYAWIIGVSTAYSLLKGSFTAAQEFGFGNIGQSDQTFSWSFFCNGVENPFRWTGAYGTYASDNGSDQITVQGSTTLANLGFSATGTIIINGTEITYTGLSSQTFTGCSAVPSSPTVGDIIFQSPVELSGSVGGGTDPAKFKIAMAHDGRLHYRKESKPSVWDYSKLDDPDNVATGSNDGDGGSKEVEFGGPGTAFGKLNKSILFFKRNIIKVLTFTQSGTRLDVPFYETLGSPDDKSTTIGAVNQKSTFSTPKGMVFTTPDKRMMLLTGVTGNNQPDYLVLSDPIQPIFDAGIHDDASGICVDNIIWYSFKSDINSTYNDVVLRGDMTRRTADKDGNVLPIQWDAPYVGWNVADWTAIYNSTTGKNEVHWHSSTSSNSYKITPGQKVDSTNGFTSTIRSWAETFGAPTKQKRIDAAFAEIRMSENTEMTAALLYDEDGVTQQPETILSGDDTYKQFTSTVYNPFGASAFGSQKFGSNPSAEDLPRYRFDLEVDPSTYFFNLSLQFSTDDAGQDWEIIRFGFRLAEIVEDNDPKFLT